ncbi:hypothetical protein NDI37_26270 [Funiculus sociatus GB2-A5]|uniref:Uncharacterized protein n=1 Tax=Funiculus sociatus GB2-A5 TaxID=2933946 RepID=A0ABV0JZ82_9CYAN|nr:MULTISPECIES: hypothetical protein [unclassified Trichocoleus]MBD1906060.1 hypothetical protein [Trichocoleus sp. FACHB-832]MBD1933623.1 hypothetical protein [Trichocoleus sp. FACHB-69]MBD2003298.1 hypothetical protein [Trichocoleus sp. FACHB-40]MBD2062380.1 hypothetical protein [Trichocoleus sp. FACHB-6]
MKCQGVNLGYCRRCFLPAYAAFIRPPSTSGVFIHPWVRASTGEPSFLGKLGFWRASHLTTAWV